MAPVDEWRIRLKPFGCHYGILRGMLLCKVATEAALGYHRLQDLMLEKRQVRISESTSPIEPALPSGLQAESLARSKGVFSGWRGR